MNGGWGCVRLNRRRAVGLILVGPPVALLAACSGLGTAPTAAPPPTSPPQATPTPPMSVAGSQATAPAASASSPTAGGTLRMGQPLELSSLDGHLGFTGAADTLGQIFDRLTEYDDNLAPQPRLAESWEFDTTLTRSS